MGDSQSYIERKGIDSLKDILINSIANPIFIKNSEHQWVVFNDAFCDFLNLERDDLLGKSDYEFFPKEEADVFWKMDDEVLKSGKTNINEEELTNSKGGRKTILTSKVRIQDENGNFYILGTITDVSEMKFDEVQLEKKNLQINAQKNEIQNIVKDLHIHSEQNLRIISDILLEISKEVDGARSSGLFSDIQNWLNSMILVHQYFGKTLNTSRISLPTYFDHLSQRITDLGDYMNVLIHGDPIILSMRYMTPLGLIITELLQASKIENKFNEVHIEVSYKSQLLQIEFESEFPLFDQQGSETTNFGLWHLLEIMTKQMNGEITNSKERKKIVVSIDEIKTLKRGVTN